MENYSQAWQVTRYEREKKSNFFCFLPHTIFAKAFLFNVGGIFPRIPPRGPDDGEGERNGTRVSAVAVKPPLSVEEAKKRVPFLNL